MPIIGNIKTRGELQDDLFCLQEERDYFQSKFLEQVSEIKAMKDELAKSKKEIRRLRMFLMEQENHPTENIMPNQIETPKANRQSVALTDDEDDEDLHIAKKDDASSLTQEEVEELDKQDKRLEAEVAANATTPPRTATESTSNSRYDEEPEEEEEDVRKSAEKLLAWASYRSTMSSRGSRSNNGDHDYSSTMSPSVRTTGSARQSLLGKMIETMEDEDDEEIDKRLLNGGGHIEEKKEGEPSLAKGSLSIDTGDA